MPLVKKPTLPRGYDHNSKDAVKLRHWYKCNPQGEPKMPVHKQR